MEELPKMESELSESQKIYVDIDSQAVEIRRRENRAAARIQSWFRGRQLRIYLSHLHRNAVIIQKLWRGFAARARFRQMEKAAHLIMKMNLYDEMAVRIQRRWRGFIVRKNIHNFYVRKRYLEGLLCKNELVRKELDELQDLQNRERDCVKMANEKTAKALQARRLNYLRGTLQHPGVSESLGRSATDQMEQPLRRGGVVSHSAVGLRVPARK